ncbi:hypothetical protein WJX81_003311 [Elliptochloris bilobata]|uniref:Uncharacterized protein n=1 Tax=Elliptochloris bilobata TaxID=381761 RepID=A0AAW1SDJ7_9CHLO
MIEEYSCEIRVLAAVLATQEYHRTDFQGVLRLKQYAVSASARKLIELQAALQRHLSPWNLMRLFMGSKITEASLRRRILLCEDNKKEEQTGRKQLAVALSGSFEHQEAVMLRKDLLLQAERKVASIRARQVKLEDLRAALHGELRLHHWESVQNAELHEAVSKYAQPVLRRRAEDEQSY